MVVRASGMNREVGGPLKLDLITMFSVCALSTTFYLNVLDRLRKRVIRVHPEIAKTWILHHDNALCHRTFSVSQFLTSKNIVVLPQASYSPDMSPCNFFLFPHTKLAVKGTHFESITNIQTAVTRVLQDIPVEAFQKCYESWKKPWYQCVLVGGKYFEEDHINVP